MTLSANWSGVAMPGADLITAAYRGDLDTVRRELEAGTDVNCVECPSDAWTPLHLAAGQGHNAVVELLLQYKAEVDTEDAEGRTALHLAAGSGRAATARILLHHGARPYCADKYGDTPLHSACHWAQPHVVSELLAATGKSGVDVQNHEGKTPLYKAIATGESCSDKEKCAELMLNAGANPHQVAKDGSSPLTLAEMSGLTSVNSLIQKLSLDV